jgi:competence ComEA-like helix-hairpin-helix protein
MKVTSIFAAGLAVALLCLSSIVFALPEDTVNINQASADEIATVLKGIGVKRAEAIVEYREEFGRFESMEELVAVQGIGQHILNVNKDRIVLTE